MKGGDTTPSILSLGTRYKGVVSYIAQSHYPLTPEKDLQYTLDRRLGELHSRSENCHKVKNP
jgi:hypothetical protein